MFVGGPSGSQGKAEREKLVSLAEASGLSGRVHFVGPQRHDMLPAFYRAADVVAVCSHSESFGFAALEAHACGRAVVGTPVGGLAHIVQHGRSGFLVEDRDPARFAAALQTLLTDGATRKSFEKHAIDAAAGFNWTSTAQEFYELYDCLANDAFPELCVC
jgi:D-inositol-3-phosphate glycosyltransferase